MRARLCGAIVLATAVGALAADAPSAYVIQKGATIAFLGDSITANGKRKGGYCRLILEELNKAGLEVEGVFAGISGHKSNDMLARLDRDVISKKPQWMTLSCGVNDVWHFKLRLGRRTFQGVSLEDYKRNITAIIDKAQAAGIKVVVLTSTMIGEDPERELNKMLIPYNEFLRKIATEKGCLLADLSRDMHEALEKIPDVPGKARMFGEGGHYLNIQNKLTTDGCHMNAKGNIMMAEGVLKALRVPSPSEKPAPARQTGRVKGADGNTASQKRASAARALFETARGAERMGQRQVAAGFYAKVVRDYPDTSYAERAAEKLELPGE
jgi:lysophospholipase L1-like esterase